MSYRDDDDDDSDSDDSSKRRQRYKLPRFVKYNLDQVQLDVIVLNWHRSQYQILDEVAFDLGWVAEKESKNDSWDVMWTDSEIGPDDLFKMHQYQKVSHFPGINVLARKNSLGKALMKLKKQFESEYNFFPLTWSLPAEFNELAMFADSEDNKKSIFIVKPEASCQGKGIFLTKSISELEGCTYVVQQYLENPLLINKLKFDFRIYVLLMGCDPLRIYIYDEGLARFATQPYKHPKQKNLKSACVHLTNYSVNKKNPNFVFNTSEEKMDVGHKRSFSSILIYLEKIGVDVSAMKSKINDLVIKTLISAQPFLSHIYRLSQPNNLYNDMCFQILGFDIILDDKFDPYLLEVNHNPSLVADTPLDKFIKKKLVKDTLNLLNINIKRKEEKVLKKRKDISDKQNGIKTKKLQPLEKQLLKKEYQALRDEYENANLGGFTKIFPLEEDKMKKYFSFLEKSQHLFEQVSGIKYDFQSESISLNKYEKRLKFERKLKQKEQGKKKCFSVKTSPRKAQLPDEKASPLAKDPSFAKIIPHPRTLSLRLNPQVKFPSIEKGKFIVPQTFNIRDWGCDLESRTPVYIRDFLTNAEEKRKRSGRKRI